MSSAFKHFQIDDAELLSILPKLCKFPTLAIIHNSVKHWICGTFPDAPVELFAYPNSDCFLWMALRRNRCVPPHLFVATDDEYQYTPETRRQLFIEAICELKSHLIELASFVLVTTHFEDSEIFAEQLHEQFDFSSKRYASYFFHMTENQQRSLIETQLSLPSSNEFDIDQLCDADLDIVVAGWSHSTEGDRDQFAQKIRHLPSVAIRHRDSGNALIAFELIDPAGYFNNQYTIESFRGRQLGTFVELKLAQKAIDANIWPIKFVEKENGFVLEWTRRSRWWTALENVRTIDKQPQIIDYRLVVRKPAPSATD